MPASCTVPICRAIEFVGMEVVRRDWTELAKLVQRELYLRLFTGRPVDEYLADIVRQVRRGELDHALVYRKGLRKNIGEYTASTPPHVAAARKSLEKPGRLICLRDDDGRAGAARQSHASA